jgi:prevent-host-death family protein
MSSVGAFEAKTRFSELLEQVSKGSEIVITRHDKPIAKLVPYETAPRVAFLEVFQKMEAFRSKHPLNPKGQSRVTYRELIEGGRRR